jgi:hypothetical protein
MIHTNQAGTVNFPQENGVSALNAEDIIKFTRAIMKHYFPITPCCLYTEA